jgi:hypothetical protein
LTPPDDPNDPKHRFQRRRKRATKRLSSTLLKQIKEPPNAPFLDLEFEKTLKRPAAGVDFGDLARLSEHLFHPDARRACLHVDETISNQTKNVKQVVKETERKAHDVCV